MAAHRVLVVGGGYAGVLAALRIARLGGARVAVTLVNPRRAFVERVRLYQLAPRGRAPSRDLGVLLAPSVRFVEGLVAGLDGSRGRALVAPVAGGGHIRDEPFDTCLIATGSATDAGGVPGVVAHACDVGSAESAARARTRLAALADGAGVIVAGGGLTAIELAAEIAETRPGLRVALVTAAAIGPGLSGKGRAAIRRHLAAHRVTLHEQTRITEVDRCGAIASGGRIDADLVFWAAGMTASPLARAVGLEVDEGGRAWVDPGLRAVGRADVFVVGDSARVAGHSLRMGCVVALPMAVQVADQILARVTGAGAPPFRFGFAVQCIGLGRRAGLLQFVAPDDTPRERVLTGRLAGFAKELICRYAGARPAREAHTAWLGRRAARQLPPLAATPAGQARGVG